MTCSNAFSTIDGWSLHIQQPDTADFCLMFSAPYGGRIASIAVKAGVGSGHCSVKINNNPVVGLDNIDFNTLKKEYSAEEDNEFAPGDQIMLSMLDGAGVVDLRATVIYSR